MVELKGAWVLSISTMRAALENLEAREQTAAMTAKGSSTSLPTVGDGYYDQRHAMDHWP